MNKLFHQQILKEIYTLLENIKPPTTRANQAEVPLLLIYNLIQSISNPDKEKPKEDNPYVYLVSMLPKIDFLSYNNHLVTNCYFETLVRYSFYFQNSEEFFVFLINQVFSDKAIKSKQKCINS